MSTSETKEKGPVQIAVEEYKATLETMAKRVGQLHEQIPLGETALTEQITAAIKELRDLKNENEAKRKVLQKPWDDRVKMIRDSFKALATEADGLSKKLTGMLDDWRRRDEKVKAEAAKKLEEEAAKLAESENIEDVQAAADKQAQAAATRSTAGKVKSKDGASTYTRKTWKFELTDMKALVNAAAAGEVPLEWLAVDQTKINAAIRDMELREVPGLRIFEQVTTHAR